MEATKDQTKQNFGQQAARFSLYVPLAVLMIGFFSSIGRDDKDASSRVALAWLNVGLITAGFLMGIVALVSMRRFGKSGILGRAVAGLLFNGLLVALVVSFLGPVMMTARVKSKVAGHWRLESAQAQTDGQVELMLQPDGAFSLKSTNGGGTNMEMIGQWVMTQKRLIGVEIREVKNGNAALVGQKMGLGTVTQVDADALVVQTEKGVERYQRVR
ncbi:MAG TPA: hypothetical protein VF669_17475 [Tepidisphaeraceae bacterium]|jgi:hypothetical protein